MPRKNHPPKKHQHKPNQQTQTLTPTHYAQKLVEQGKAQTTILDRGAIPPHLMGRVLRGRSHGEG